MAAKQLIAEGHQVVLHARNERRGKEAIEAVPKAESVLIGDLSNIAETKRLAQKENELGIFDAVIHNAGIYKGNGQTLTTVNTFAPYLLTCLINPPKRLIYLSSGLHMNGEVKLIQMKTGFDGINYSDTKLHVVMLANAVARMAEKVKSNTVKYGWVPTKMGGAGAIDNLQMGYETQVWLATDQKNQESGQYYFHKQIQSPHILAQDVDLQNELVKVCDEITGVQFPF